MILKQVFYAGASHVQEYAQMELLERRHNTDLLSILMGKNTMFIVSSSRCYMDMIQSR